MFRCFLACCLTILSFHGLSVVEASKLSEETPTPLVAPKPLIQLDEIHGPLPLDFVVAKLDGESITLLDLGGSISSEATMKKMQNSFEPYQLRQIQEELIETHLGYYLREQLFVRHYKRKLSQEQLSGLEERLSWHWKTRLQSLLQEYDADSIEELETHLSQHDMKPLSEMRQDFENRALTERYMASERYGIEGLFSDGDCQTVIEFSRLMRILGL